MPPKVTGQLNLDGVIGPPEVNTRGHNLQITKKLTGVSIVETIPDVRKPLRGKTEYIKTMIPVADVIDKFNSMHDAVADAERKVRIADERAAKAHQIGVEKGSTNVNVLANKYLDEEQKKRQEVEKKLATAEKKAGAEKKKADFAKQKFNVAQKTIAKTKKSLKAVKKRAESLDEDLTIKENEAREALDLYHKTQKELDELKERRRRRVVETPERDI